VSGENPAPGLADAAGSVNGSSEDADSDRGHGMRHRKATKKRVGKRADLKMAGPRQSRRGTKGRTAGAGERDEGVIDLFVTTYRSLG
jgi:hypothetical protein